MPITPNINAEKIRGNLTGTTSICSSVFSATTVTSSVISATTISGITYYVNNIYLPSTTTGTTTGVIYKANSRFIHDFNYGYNGTATTIGQNIFIGINSGNFTMGSTATANTQSSYNVCVGQSSGINITKGQQNTYVGAQAGQATTEGDYNVFVGTSSGWYNNLGQQNTYIGAQAGRYISDGVNGNSQSTLSTFIGFNTKSLTSGDTNQTVIGGTAVGNGSNTVTIGNSSIINNYFKGTLNVPIVSATTYSGNSIYMPNTTAGTTTGVIYKGNNRFIHDFNYGVVGTATTVGQNTFVGINAGNFTMGSTALNNYESSTNTGFGYQALLGLTRGYDNVAVGQSAAANMSSGYSNVVVGARALYQTTFGASNVALGSSALYANTIGQHNIGIGYATLFGITTNSSNIGIGTNAGRFISGGATTLTSSTSSIFIGTNSYPLNQGQSNQIVIGDTAIGNGSNTVTIGNSSITNNYFKGTLEVPTLTATTISATTAFINGTTNFFGDILSSGATRTIGTTDGTNIQFKTNNTIRALFNATGSGFVVGPAGLAYPANLGTSVNARSNVAWTTNGLSLVQAACTFIDQTSVGVVNNVYGDYFGVKTFAASSAVTYNNIYGTYLDLPTTGTNVSAVTIYTLGVNGNIAITGTTRTNSLTATTISATTAVFSSTGNTTLSVYGSGTTNPVFTVQGSQGELFSINDSLQGSLFSVNDISGLPILEVFSDNTVLIGSYQAPSLNTTVKKSLTAGTNSIYSIPTSAYTGAFIDYTLMDSAGARAGNIMSIWSGTSAQYIETKTSDIGSNTSGVTFSVGISGNYAVLSSSATTSGTTVRCIIRSI